MDIRPSRVRNRQPSAPWSGSVFTQPGGSLSDRRSQSPEQPSLKELRRSGKPSVEALEAAVEELFGHETKRRRGRLKLYALRQYSGLGATAIAERYSRRHPSAVAPIGGEGN